MRREFIFRRCIHRRAATVRGDGVVRTTHVPATVAIPKRGAKHVYTE
jgi:hypothetical protein